MDKGATLRDFAKTMVNLSSSLLSAMLSIPRSRNVGCVELLLSLGDPLGGQTSAVHRSSTPRVTATPPWSGKPLWRYSVVVKADLRTGTSKVWLKDAEDQLCAEPILVNKPGYAKEDEGVLIVPVITTRDNDHPYVVILDAETMEEQARFTIPQSRIPFGFHAHYTPSKDCR
ncbi:hypothetical protein RB195_011774 [Necator americanus]|uniref:Dioxygenase n=1 Tax=Necator americanus TaxID=51031 RepID=A0ABR1D769_NECAM